MENEIKNEALQEIVENVAEKTRTFEMKPGVVIALAGAATGGAAVVIYEGVKLGKKLLGHIRHKKAIDSSVIEQDESEEESV